MPGYDLDLFVCKESAQRYVCAVCQNVCKNVCETKCGHLFCQDCVDRLIEVSSSTNENNNNNNNNNNGSNNNDDSNNCAQCPHCRESLFRSTIHFSKFTNRIITNLQVKCNLCQLWKGSLMDVNSHQMNDCTDYLIDCPFRKYGCVLRIKRKDIDSHIENKDNQIMHLQCKLNFQEKHNKMKTNKLIRKYESEIVSINLKWKQKFIAFHKQSLQSRQDTISKYLNDSKHDSIFNGNNNNSNNNNNNNNNNSHRGMFDNDNIGNDMSDNNNNNNNEMHLSRKRKRSQLISSTLESIGDINDEKNEKNEKSNNNNNDELSQLQMSYPLAKRHRKSMRSNQRVDRGKNRKNSESSSESELDYSNESSDSSEYVIENESNENENDNDNAISLSDNDDEYIVNAKNRKNKMNSGRKKSKNETKSKEKNDKEKEKNNSKNKSNAEAKRKKCIKQSIA